MFVLRERSGFVSCLAGPISRPEFGLINVMQ